MLNITLNLGSKQTTTYDTRAAVIIGGTVITTMRFAPHSALPALAAEVLRLPISSIAHAPPVRVE